MTADAQPGGSRWLVPGFLAVVLVAVLNTLRSTVADPDLWGYLAFGRLFWQGPSFPYRDIFAYVPTLDPWIYHEWLTGVVFYPVWQSLGAPGLQVLKYLLGLAAAFLMYATGRRGGADPLSAALVLWMAQLFLAVGYSPVRAQVFTFFFFGLSFYLLEGARLEGRWRPLGWLPLLMVLWCNFHGGFPAGLGLMGLYVVGEALSRRPFWPYAAAGGASFLAVLVNPYGLGYLSYMVRAVTMPRPEISEWVSVFKAFQLGLFSEANLYFLTMAVFALCLARWARWREITPALSLLVTLYLGLKHVRHQVFFIMLCGAYLPALLHCYLEELRSRPGFQALMGRLGWRAPALALAALGLVNLYGVLRHGSLKINVPPVPGKFVESKLYYPVGALDYINRWNLSGNILLEFGWGEYVLWEMYPRLKVALDGRYETVYPEDVAREYFDFAFGRDNWRRFLKHYPPDLVLLRPGTTAYPLMLGEGGWRQVYADQGCVLLVRESLRPGAVSPRP